VLTTLAERLEPGRLAFNRGAHFEAHELWEDVWLDLAGGERVCVQGLIQIAAGLHHLGQQRRRPAAGLLRKGLEKITQGSCASLSPLRVEALAGAVTQLLAVLATGEEGTPDVRGLTL
jgi:predicted metal-dependent hydrolase